MPAIATLLPHPTLPQTTPNVAAPDRRRVSGPAEKGLAIADGLPAGVAQWLINEVEDHRHLQEAKLVLIWKAGLEPDADGRVELGKARKATLLQRLGFEEADFLVFLNLDRWLAQDPRSQFALLDHELLHCAATVAAKYVAPENVDAFIAGLEKHQDLLDVDDDAIDDKGRTLVRWWPRDDDGRRRWRVRKHDVETFSAVVARWGNAAPETRPLYDWLEPPDDGQLLLAFGKKRKGSRR